MARLIVSKLKKKNLITHQGDLKAILQMGRLVSLLPPTPIDMTLRENISSTTFFNTKKYWGGGGSSSKVSTHQALFGGNK